MNNQNIIETFKTLTAHLDRSEVGELLMDIVDHYNMEIYPGCQVTLYDDDQGEITVCSLRNCTDCQNMHGDYSCPAA